MRLIAHHFPGQVRPGKLQMMASGGRRYLFQLVFEDDWLNPMSAKGQIVDVTNPLKPVVVNDDAFRAFNIQVAYRAEQKRWVLMESKEYLDTLPLGVWPGLRGVRFTDVSDPTNPVHLSDHATDGGAPDRWLQTGSGTHRNYWDGGRYAYLSTSHDDGSYFPERKDPWTRYVNSLQIIDVADLRKPKVVSRWSVPGQRVDETSARAGWRSAGDDSSYDGLHGPMYVPRPVEQGGRYGYSGWGTHGLLIHDLSDPALPRVVGRWNTPDYVPGPMIAHHTVDPTRIDRGFVITNPESIYPDCSEAWHDTWVIDVSDPTSPSVMAKLPRPSPPPEAPYSDFCQKRGRYGSHNAPHLKAPGRPHPNFTAYTYFNGGLQCYDLTDPANPSICGYYVPPQNGRMEDPRTFERSADDVFIEWDRALMWLATNNGLHLLSHEMLGEPVLGPRAVRSWSVPGLNEGHR